MWSQLLYLHFCYVLKFFTVTGMGHKRQLSSAKSPEIRNARRKEKHSRHNSNYESESSYDGEDSGGWEDGMLSEDQEDTADGSSISSDQVC